MEENLNHIVYSKNVLEFVTIAGEYCVFIESAHEISKADFLLKSQKLLPLLYLKGTLLPNVENEYDEIIEKIVTEEMWNHYEQIIKQKLGKHNDYLEVFDPNISLTEGPINESISEKMTDIFQDIKDFISVFRIGTVDIMNDALWECLKNFEQYWGQKLLNVLRAIHMIIYGEEELDDEDEMIKPKNDQENVDTSDWILTKMQQQHRKDNDE